MKPLDGGRLDNYVSNFDANEDELAWEGLVDAANAGGATANVWARLADVARAMNLRTDDAIYGGAVRLALDHLPK